MDTGLKKSGGEGGIRTPDTGFGPYNGLANRRLQPLGHLSAGFVQQQFTISDRQAIAASRRAMPRRENRSVVPSEVN